MIINAHDPCLEVNLQENIQEIAGLCQFAQGNVLDVGANVGSHTINFAKTADMVYAFEPHPHTYWNLCANCLLHQALNVQPFQYAIGSRDGSTNIWNIDPTRRNSAMGIMVDTGSLVVPIRKIDSLEISPLHFIKIDVEGHELEVLRGAEQTLQRESLIVFVEIHSDELLEPIIAFMDGLQYLKYEFVHTVYAEKDGSGCTYGYLFWKQERITWK